MPPRTYVSTVLPSKYKAGRVYVTFDGHYSDDYKPYVFVSDDFGATWRSLSAGLPETSINRIREHPTQSARARPRARARRALVERRRRDVELAGDRDEHADGAGRTTRSSRSATTRWSIGTHGRGIWILDDVGPLEALTADAMAADATLFPIHRARLMSTFTPQAWYGAGEFFAPNPDWNAAITYYLRDARERAGRHHRDRRNRQGRANAQRSRGERA